MVSDLADNNSIKLDKLLANDYIKFTVVLVFLTDAPRLLKTSENIQ